MTEEIRERESASSLEGQIWSSLRSELPYHRDLIAQIGNVQKYEIESAMLDSLARHLAKAVKKRLDRIDA